jgi:hypothetical protein
MAALAVYAAALAEFPPRAGTLTPVFQQRCQEGVRPDRQQRPANLAIRNQAEDATRRTTAGRRSECIRPGCRETWLLNRDLIEADAIEHELHRDEECVHALRPRALSCGIMGGEGPMRIRNYRHPFGTQFGTHDFYRVPNSSTRVYPAWICAHF